MLDLDQFGGGPTAKCDNFVDAVPVLVLQAADQRQPFFDLVQACRVELDLALIVSQRLYQVVQCVFDLGRLLATALHLWVDAPQAGQRAHGLAQQVNCRSLFILSIEQVDQRLAAQLGQPLGVGQPIPLLHQVLVLAGLQLRGIDLLDLVAKQVDAAAQLALAAHQLVQLAANGAQLAYLTGQHRPLGLQAGVTVEKVEVRAFLEQREVFALSVDVDQVPADRLQDAQPHGSTVNATHVVPAAADLSG